jgi:peroxiredoxin
MGRLTSMRTKIPVAIFIAFSILTLFAQHPVMGRLKAFDFALTDIYGEEFQLSDHLGKVVLINFFATYCGSCRQEMLELKSIWERFSSDRFVAVSVSVDMYQDTENVLLDFVNEYEMNWTVAQDIVGISSQYSVSAIPTLVLVDPEGYVAYTHVGVTRESTLSQEIQDLLQTTTSTPGQRTNMIDFWRDYGMWFLVGVSTAAIISALFLTIRYDKNRRPKTIYMSEKHSRSERLC